jgi:AraC-like DNA-binding protein
MQHGIERYVAGDLLAPTTAVSFKAQEIRRVEVHWHDYYELGYVSAGTATHTVNGEDHRLSRGSVFLLTPADFHEIRADSEELLSCYNVVIDSWHWETRLAALFSSGPEYLPWVMSDLSALEPDFARLWRELREGRPGAALVVHAVLDCIVVELGRASPAGPRLRRVGEREVETSDIQRAVLYVDRHFRAPLTLADVAAQAHLSPNYFSERFHGYTGTTFQRYLQQRRLRFARSLLASTSLGVTEVCHAAGFNSLSHFGRAFRHEYGEAPTTFVAGGRQRSEASAAAEIPRHASDESGI